MKKIEKNRLNEKNKDKKNSGLAAISIFLFIFSNYLKAPFVNPFRVFSPEEILNLILFSTIDCA